MTRRICVLGNSHVAALKLGWKQIEADYPDTVVDFFAAPRTGIFEVEIADGKITAVGEMSIPYFTQTGGRAEVTLADYEKILVVGCGLNIQKVINVIRFHRPLSLLGSKRQRRAVDFHTDDDQEGYQPPRLVSGALFREILMAGIRKSPVYPLIESLARETGTPLSYVLSPLPSSEIATLRQSSIIAMMTRRGWHSQVAETFWQAMDAAMKGRAHVLRPPAETIVNDLMTDSKYSAGAVKLGDGRGEHTEDDLLHMNGDYGALVMRSVIAGHTGAVDRQTDPTSPDETA